MMGWLKRLMDVTNPDDVVVEESDNSTILVDKYFEYRSTRGLNGKQSKMLQVLSKEVCKMMTQDIVDEVSRISMGLMFGTISKEEADVEIEEIKNKMLKEGGYVEK